MLEGKLAARDEQVGNVATDAQEPWADNAEDGVAHHLAARAFHHIFVLRVAQVFWFTEMNLGDLSHPQIVRQFAGR